MLKTNFYKYPYSLIDKNIIKIIAFTLSMLITFNLGWLISFIRLFSQLKAVIILNKILFYFVTILLLGNLLILAIFIAYIASIKILRSLIGR